MKGNEGRRRERLVGSGGQALILLVCLFGRHKNFRRKTAGSSTCLSSPMPMLPVCVLFGARCAFFFMPNANRIRNNSILFLMPTPPDSGTSKDKTNARSALVHLVIVSTKSTKLFVYFSILNNASVCLGVFLFVICLQTCL